MSMSIPTLDILRDFTTADIIIRHMAPDLSIQPSSIGIEEESVSADKFLEKAWEMTSNSLDTFAARAIYSAREPEPSPKEMRRRSRNNREQRKRCVLITVCLQADGSLYIDLFRAQGRHWICTNKITVPKPSSNADFISALEKLGFFTAIASS